MVSVFQKRSKFCILLLRGWGDVWRWLCWHVRGTISAHVDGGGGWATPIGFEQKFVFNIFIVFIREKSCKSQDRIFPDFKTCSADIIKYRMYWPLLTELSVCINSLGEFIFVLVFWNCACSPKKCPLPTPTISYLEGTPNITFWTSTLCVAIQTLLPIFFIHV